MLTPEQNPFRPAPPDDELPAATALCEVLRSRHDDTVQEEDQVIEEVPVALAYNGISHAVMLASPADLEDFAVGFSLGEGIVGHAGEIHDLEIEAGCHGITVDMTIATPRFLALKERRRSLAGRTGCGLCGIDSLAALAAHAAPSAVRDAGARLNTAAIDEALRQLPHWQPLRERTGASHGAAWVDARGNIRCLREDVGRHNALDKLLGALARTGEGAQRGGGGFVLITSRASYEMVQKAARAGVSALVAVSAPTALAIRQAQAAGLLLVGFARDGRRVAYSHAERLDCTPSAVAAQSFM
ncbi:formate dehydrogenase accessory sulfurtransferase FdhD [Pseudothauera rhizosphaerae]|uniref:Sulfur carrier protein FdhD n=1 Tax=Pseudothauera rhizosphaerae TaxID=2565932 RepID=A0A4S4AYN5_9RHOO|nr:formate dehydrogenase accessory sulfurtransferase FdhD [Pseudothauera rhizosphaerae]THF65220.1 formate dehydrogenase accessory sulfurtransferase FdhD [Pseudothauera rhizosphaerae]